jgi:hypothetical protein
MLSVIDFCPPHGDNFLQRNISDFLTTKRIEFDVNDILRGIESKKKRIEIAKVALDRWAGLKR